MNAIDRLHCVAKQHPMADKRVLTTQDAQLLCELIDVIDEPTKQSNLRIRFVMALLNKETPDWK